MGYENRLFCAIGSSTMFDEGLESAREVPACREVRQLDAELIVVNIVKAFDEPFTFQCRSFESIYCNKGELLWD